MVSHKEIKRYYSTHPDEARELLSILMASAKSNDKEESHEWLTARQVGDLVHKSSRWVKDHDNILPQSSIKRGARNANLYKWNDNTRHLFNIQL